MTDKRMALVPREATEDMKRAGVWALEQWREKIAKDMYAKAPDKHGIRFDAMLTAAPNAGKVSREQFLSARNAAARVRILVSPAGHLLGRDADNVTIAVIKSLGLEIEE